MTSVVEGRRFGAQKGVRGRKNVFHFKFGQKSSRMLEEGNGRRFASLPFGFVVAVGWPAQVDGMAADDYEIVQAGDGVSREMADWREHFGVDTVGMYLT
jgi:hypothetical protein